MDDVYKTRLTLIKKIQDQHDEKAWEEFIEIYKKYVYAIIREVGIPQHDVEDILQRVMLNLWKRLPEMEADEIRRFRSYLGRMTQNAIYEYMRKKGQRASRLEKAVNNPDLNYTKSIDVPEINEIAQREWEHYLTNLAMENISRQFAGNAIEAFTLSMKGMELDEIAEKLKIKSHSVYRLRSRVKERLIQEVKRLRSELE